MNRIVTTVGVVALVGGLLMGCSKDEKKEDAKGSSSSSSSATSAAASPYDITKIESLKDQFPPGFNVRSTPKTEVTQAMLDQVKAQMGGITTDPPECVDQLTGAMSSGVGASMTMVMGATTPTADSPMPTIIMVQAAETKNPMPQDTNGKCDKFTLTMAQVGATGSADRTDAPQIDGVPTRGTTATFSINGPGGGVSMNQTAYVANIDDNHIVAVQSVGDVDNHTLGDLFTKAVGAVKGS